MRTLRAPRALALAAILVLALAGCGGGAGDGDGGGGDGAAAVSLRGTDQLEFSKTQLSAAPGEISIELTCGESINHDVTIEGEAGDEPVVECQPGETSTGTVELDAGSYTFYCSVPGHREAGMEGTLTVGG